MAARATARAAESAALHAALARKTVDLYKRIARETPRVLIMYDIEGYTPASARSLLLRKYFRKHAGVTDPRIKDVLLAKGEMELKETLEQWKQKVHLLDLLQEEEAEAEPWTCEEIVRRFENKTFDDEMVWAGHDQRVLDARVARLRAHIKNNPHMQEEFARIEKVERLIAKLEAPLPAVGGESRPLPHGAAGRLSCAHVPQ